MHQREDAGRKGKPQGTTAIQLAGAEGYSDCEFKGGHGYEVIDNNDEDSEEDEWHTLETFKALDRNGNGRISVAELKYDLEQAGEMHTYEEVRDMLREADHNRDGRVTYEEFANRE